MAHSTDPSPQSLHGPLSDCISIPRSDDMADTAASLSTELDLFHELIKPGKELESTEAIAPSALCLEDINTHSVLSNWLPDWSPENHPDSAFRDENYSAIQAQHAFSQAMYQNSIEGYHVGNPSCQTFATTSSSEGETPSLMTPPPRTSPLPFVPQDAFGRRESVTADLTNNFDTIRLQQPQSSLNGYQEMIDNHSAATSQTPSGTPPAPSELRIDVSGTSTSPSLRTAHQESSAPRLDLASRRKGPRPAALRPDAHRSQSYAGPLTMSPTSRVPSLGFAKSNSVRRIKSTGNGLNVMNGRIQKSGLSPAQLSPHNLQSVSTAHLLASQNAGTSDDTGNAPLTPLSPEATDQMDHLWSQSHQWAGEHSHSTSIGVETDATITSPPITPFDGTLQQPFSSNQPHTAYHWPPQSAPPQQTSFFNDSPPVAPTNFAHLGWQVPSSTSLHGYAEEPLNPTVARPAFLTQYDYHDSQPFPGHHPSQLHSYQMGFCHPHTFQPPPQPQKELEIQVQVFPAPEGLPQGRKTYTFNHTTPKDFSSQEGTPSKVVGTNDTNLV